MTLDFSTDRTRTSLFGAVLSAARENGPGKIILEDPDRQPLTYRRLLLASLVLGDRISRLLPKGEAAGVLLPNVNGHVVTLIGLNAMGRTVGLLNFTAGTKNIVSAVRTGPLPTVVTSRRFIETAQLGDVVSALAVTELSSGQRVCVLYLEDIRKDIGAVAKTRGLFRLLFSQLFWRRNRNAAANPAVILFTSGTEGEPKGVVLTNANLLANAEQIYTHAAGMLSPADTVMNPLPIFHSFGLTAATLMPLLKGLRVVLYPSPLHYKQIPKLIAATKATVLFATDTFLQGYVRAAEPRDLASIRYVIAGAERVKEQTRRAWAETGAMILEGYGATECSPVIACNLPQANRPGSVGRLLPGIEARLEPVAGIAKGGRLMVKGPNVMAGYLMAGRPGILVPPVDGWHDTGDIVAIEDGYVSITGRAKRFAKIGGEMVSLAAVEGLCAELWNEANHVVVSVPDARKGEALVLVTSHPNADREELVAHAREVGFPELAVPKTIMTVPAIPVLGSGKVDLAATLDLVRKGRMNA